MNFSEMMRLRKQMNITELYCGVREVKLAFDEYTRSLQRFVDVKETLREGLKFLDRELPQELFERFRTLYNTYHSTAKDGSKLEEFDFS